MRLQKIFSQAGVASRRAAERLITDGRVSVNGRTILELGTKADPDADDVRVDGRRIRAAARLRYRAALQAAWLRHHAVGSAGPTHGPRPARGRAYLYPVGRLDYDIEGLLLLTNDGELTAVLTHPRHGTERTYEAEVAGVPDDRALARLRTGVVLDSRRTRPARVVRLPAGRHTTRALLRITLREGRNRQVRRMCEAVGHPVRRLVRTRFGPLRDRHLQPGEWRDLTPAEVRALERSVSTTPRPRR